MIPRIPGLLRTPFNFALLIFEAGMFLTGNVADAIQFYHEAVAEIMELVRP